MFHHLYGFGVLVPADGVFFPDVEVLLGQDVVGHGPLAVEDDADLLEGDFGGFGVGEVDQGDDQDDDDVDDQVVPPANVLEGDRVEVVEAGDGGLDQEVLGADELGPDVVAHALDRVAGEDAVPGRGVKGVEDEDEGDDRRAGVSDPVLDVQGAADGPRQETRDEHPAEGRQHHGPAAEPVNHVGAPKGPTHVPHGQAPVDDALGAGVRDADAVEDHHQVVPDDGLARGLARDRTRHHDPGAVPVARGAHEVEPAPAAVLPLVGQRLDDLVVLEPRERVGLVAPAVDVDEGLERLFVAASADEPPWRLGHPPRQGQGDEGREHLDQRHAAPAPVALD